MSRTILLVPLVLGLLACEREISYPSISTRWVSEPEFVPPNAVILPGTSAPTLLRQCSRESPALGEEVWEPDWDDVRRLEARLLDALSADDRASSVPLERIHTDWTRQYVGVVRNGRRYIYANFFPRRPEREEWRTETWVICDGGPWIFGVEFDVEQERFTHLAFNGSA